MSRPQRYLNRMFLFLIAVCGVAFLLFPTLAQAFAVNGALNSLILGVLAFGILYIFRQVTRLFREVRWLSEFRTAKPGTVMRAPEPVLLSPLANMLADRGPDHIRLSAQSMRSVLDGLGARLDESRELSRYLINLLIFLGLLGTFWGLLNTIHSVAGVISTLSVEGNDLGTMFGSLQSGLAAPLAGMGTAFSASLFGLAGSLVLGFLELQASQAQNRFFQEVEDWLSGATRLSSGVGLGDGEHSVPAYLEALLEQTAENLDTLQRTMGHYEEGRRSTNANLAALAERLSTLTDQMRAEQALLLSLAESMVGFKPVLARLSDSGNGGFGIDDGSRQHIRNIDVHLARLVQESTSGRDKMVQELRSDIKLIARTIAALAEGAEPR
ncbi:MAG: flagellar motor protein MotA [Rhodospirillaceae bacterium]